MNLIINDLSIVAPRPESPAPAAEDRGEAAPTPRQSPPPSALRSEDLERALRRFQQRRMRLWAA